MGRHTYIAAQPGNTGVQGVFAGCRIIGIAPDSLEAAGARTNRTWVAGQVQQQPILQRAELKLYIINLDRAGLLVNSNRRRANLGFGDHCLLGVGKVKRYLACT